MTLRAARVSAKLTQAQVAMQVGVSTMAYQRYEYNQREPCVRTAILIAKVLDSSVEELFRKTQSEPDGNQT